MMIRAHNRYNTLFRQTHKTFQIRDLALLMFKDYITIVLLLQLPISIKLKVQVLMSLFSIETAPVPLDAETYIREKREYTQIILETELIALTETNYVPLTQVQISLCAKIGYMYYCEYAHLLKNCTDRTCMSKPNNVKLLSHSILYQSLKY